MVRLRGGIIGTGFCQQSGTDDTVDRAADEGGGQKQRDKIAQSVAGDQPQAGQQQLQRVQAWVQAAQTHFDQPLVTEVALLQRYLRAEDYHQDYFNQHPYQGYCMMVVAPKVQKFQQTFADWQR